MRLTRAGSFCYIGNFYVGTLAYAADMILIAPSASAMRKMFAICDSFATKYCVSFNAKKSKCHIINVRMNDADDMSQTRYFHRTSEQCFVLFQHPEFFHQIQIIPAILQWFLWL